MKRKAINVVFIPSYTPLGTVDGIGWNARPHLSLFSEGVEDE